MQVRYGAEWNRMWEGIEPDAVKADWEENLRIVFERNPAAIAKALDNLPDRPPTSDQFRKICNSGPSVDVPRLPEPSADPAIVAGIVEKMTASKPKHGGISPAQECINNIERIVHDRGGKISSQHRHMVAHCLRMPDTSTKLGIEAAR